MQIKVMQAQSNFDNYSMRHGKQLEGLMKKRGKYFFCSKKRMIFEGWRDHIHNERTAYQRLVAVMRGVNRRIAFGKIRGRAF